jgi:hypothetical protein
MTHHRSPRFQNFLEMQNSGFKKNKTKYFTFIPKIVKKNLINFQPKRKTSKWS